jgi:hypothetical protein
MNGNYCALFLIILSSKSEETFSFTEGFLICHLLKPPKQH